MEIEIGPFSKYEDAKMNAYWSRAAIDTRLKVDEHDIFYYKEHMRDCVKNPTVGMLVKRKYITEKPMNYPECAKRNIRYLERLPEIASFKCELKENMNRMYHKTKHIRQYIVDHDRVQIDSVERVKKYTIPNKLAIFLRSFK